MKKHLENAAFALLLAAFCISTVKAFDYTVAAVRSIVERYEIINVSQIRDCVEYAEVEVGPTFGTTTYTVYRGSVYFSFGKFDIASATVKSAKCI